MKPNLQVCQQTYFILTDSLGRFHAANALMYNSSKKAILIEGKEYIQFNALGKAILRSLDEQKCIDLVPKNFKHGGKRRSVVLIDEIDKAPKGFPK